jgi:hypothetical protein
MTYKILLAAGLSTAFALSAAAQQPATPTATASPTQGQSTGNGASQKNADVQQHMTQDLQKAGFTTVEVMPESFLVRAKDKDGRAVMMVINPDSITSVTAVSVPAASGSQTTASATPSGSAKKD